MHDLLFLDRSKHGEAFPWILLIWEDFRLLDQTSTGGYPHDLLANPATRVELLYDYADYDLTKMPLPTTRVEMLYDYADYDLNMLALANTRVEMLYDYADYGSTILALV